MTWDHVRVEELLAGQALGVLDPDEADLAERALVEHVPECPRCRRALSGYQALAGDLALAAPPATPPAGLRRRVLRSSRDSRVRATPAPSRWVGWAAAIVAVVALAGWNLLMVGRLDRAEARQALMVEATAAAGRPDASVVPMRGAPGVRAAMIYVHENHDAYFLASGLPVADGDYQLWLVVESGRWISLGTFDTYSGIAVMRSRTRGESIRQVVVTEEPEGGSDRPSGRRVVSAQISRGDESSGGDEGSGGGGSSGPG